MWLQPKKPAHIRKKNQVHYGKVGTNSSSLKAYPVFLACLGATDLLELHIIKKECGKLPETEK